MHIHVCSESRNYVLGIIPQKSGERQDIIYLLGKEINVSKPPCKDGIRSAVFPQKPFFYPSDFFVLTALYFGKPTFDSPLYNFHGYFSGTFYFLCSIKGDLTSICYCIWILFPPERLSISVRYDSGRFCQ